MSHPSNDQIIDAIRDGYDADEIREMIVKFGRLRQLQGQAEGPGGWVREPYDLRVEADKILDEIEEAL
jgi:hypothetical protein